MDIFLLYLNWGIALILLMTKSSMSTSTCRRKDRNETMSPSTCEVRQEYYSSNATTDYYTHEEELRKRLTPLQYHVTQEKGTERPFTGCYNDMSRRGNYSCVVCDAPLFSSDTKFDSHCGWPAFNDVLDQGRVRLTSDTSHGMIRTEVTCSKCNAHLGHMFMDGPLPTRKRFCINSASLNFHPTVA